MASVRPPVAAEEKRFLQLLEDTRARMADCDMEFVAVGVRRMRSRLIVDGMRPELVAEAFALIDLTVQEHLQLRLHDAQFLAAWLMLDRRLVEMQTGEGKTLAVALAAATAALAGTPVHVVTGNDYLVQRDAAALGPVFRALGLTVGTVTTSATNEQRMQAYRCGITYCTAKELVFDYLRDHMASATAEREHGAPTLRLRSLCMAIVDEADSVLIDEARVPLILSEPAPNQDQAAFCRQALFLSAQLVHERDYQLDHRRRIARLTSEGQSRAQRLAERIGGTWNAARRRDDTLCLALAARHLYQKDVHYLVRDGQVVIVDETTGRPAQGRSWSRGLHQLIEAKEGCSLTEAGQTVAQITFQRFFSRYLRLSGISGTLAEARAELLAIYGLPVVCVPLRLPCRRLHVPGDVFAQKSAQWCHVSEQVREYKAAGRPVLIGTGSVRDSEALSAQLHRAGIPHTVLNARFDAEEAHIIARAGEAGAVTVSTNMAGRGTDIALGVGVAERGGLHVIACQANDSRRIDRQLHGRCARQGDPGSVQQLYCIEDRFGAWPTMMRLATTILATSGRPLPRWLAALFLLDQRRRERIRRREQWFLYLNDRRRDRQMAFISHNE